MQTILLIALFGCLTTLALGLNVPLVDEDLDTVAVDESTTLSYVGDLDEKRTQHECTTARGIQGSCLRVQQCYPSLLPPDVTGHDASTGTYNQALAEILVNVSGFCAGGLEARSDITPIIFEQVMRSEVMLCCPDQPKAPTKMFVLDAPTNETSDDEAFRAKSCGYLKIDTNDLSVVNDTSETGKIVKGRKTAIGEFAWIVAMMNRGRQFCGGSLISERTILTAAHCVQHMTASDVKDLRLQIGDYDIYKQGEVQHVTRGATKVLYHKGFSMRHLQHDIALIILDKPVSFSPTIQPVCLHPGNPVIDDGTVKADVAGWGALSEGGGQPSDLRAVRVGVSTKARCLQRYANSANKITDGMVCAGSDQGEDSCQGDSGGPLTIDSRTQAKQIGVVSWGIGCGRYPGVYTRVDRYLTWINKNRA